MNHNILGSRFSITQYKESDSGAKNEEVHSMIYESLQSQGNCIIKYSRIETVRLYKNTFGSKYKQNKKILELSRRTKKKLTGTGNHRRERKISDRENIE